MKQLFLTILIVLLFTNSASIAQGVAINNDNSAPDPIAMLDVKSTTKGLLVPRMTQAQRIAITTPANGLLIYQTDNPSGFYYFNGSGWFRLSLQNEGWSTTGNAGTNPANNFFGTTDNQPLSFRLNNAPAGKFDHIKGNYYIGSGSGYSNTTGQGNIAIGNGTLKSNTDGSASIAIGDSALYNHNELLGDAIAIGYKTLFSDISGRGNIAIGSGTLNKNISGVYNIAIGANALLSNTTGNANIAIGGLNENSTASSNTAVGYNVMDANTTGDYNAAYGYQALANTTTGSGNTAVGSMAGYNLQYYVNNVTAIGNFAGFNTTPSNHINIGNTSNIWIGGQVNWGVWSDRRIKKDIQQNVPGLSFIMQLNPVTYHLDIHKQNEMVYTKGSDTLSWPTKYEIETITQSGFIAQEVEQAAKENNYEFSGVVVPKSDEGLYSIRYAEFVVPLVKAVQELSLSNDEMKAIVNNQQRKIEELENTINKLTN